MATRTTYDGDGTVLSIENIPDLPLRTMLYPVEIRNAFTDEERAVIFASTDPVVRDLLHWLGMCVDQLDVQGEAIQQGLGYLVYIGLLTSDRMAVISLGIQG